ncbi:uncharacterized protein LOC132611913 [Lycium barbarum]|uniref:uncharacterized protein LOC132611913 n=1 Tax=Lycium barbarum TaxID=112863 RepID=UPI00293E5155|nr:uncharacterized protein LOC132611913 [Lycium barbarum]
MEEQLDQFEKKKVWNLVPKPENASIIGTKWAFRIKLNEAQGYSQQEGVDYDETFAPVGRIESIRIFLAYASFKKFKLFQMDVKSTFLNGFIEEEVYVKQPPAKYAKELVQKYGTADSKAIGTLMSPTCTLDKDEAGKHVDETLCAGFEVAPKESHLTVVKQIIRYLHGTTNYDLWYPNTNNFALEGFSDSPFSGDKNNRKSTSAIGQPPPEVVQPSQTITPPQNILDYSHIL